MIGCGVCRIAPRRTHPSPAWVCDDDGDDDGMEWKGKRVHHRSIIYILYIMGFGKEWGGVRGLYDKTHHLAEGV